MKKTVIALAAFFSLVTFPVQAVVVAAGGAVAAAAASSSARAGQKSVNMEIEALKGKEIDGCKIIAAFFDGYKLHVLCLKDGQLYRAKQSADILPQPCESLICSGSDDERIGHVLQKSLKTSENHK